MDRNKFENIAENVFFSLPRFFRDKIDNVHIVVEDYPSEEVILKNSINKTTLLGLYQGIPLTYRSSWYGSSPTTPDKITLYQKNIESVSQDDNEIAENIREVLFHELGHFFGMNETEIRNAMKKSKPLY